jgi:hypothetical protein
MGEKSVTRGREPIDLHGVTLALSKARAARVLLMACAHGSDYFQMPVYLSKDDERDTRAWLESFGFDALEAALDEADAAFRKSLTPEQVHEQVIGPKVVA